MLVRDQRLPLDEVPHVRASCLRRDLHTRPLRQIPGTSVGLIEPVPERLGLKQLPCSPAEHLALLVADDQHLLGRRLAEDLQVLVVSREALVLINARTSMGRGGLPEVTVAVGHHVAISGVDVQCQEPAAKGRGQAREVQTREAARGFAAAGHALLRRGLGGQAAILRRAVGLGPHGVRWSSTLLVPRRLQMTTAVQAGALRTETFLPSRRWASRELWAPRRRDPWRPAPRHPWSCGRGYPGLDIPTTCTEVV